MLLTLSVLSCLPWKDGPRTHLSHKCFGLCTSARADAAGHASGGPPLCHLVSDLLGGLQPGLLQGLLLQESLYVVVAGGVAAVEATLQVSPAMASMVRRTFRTSAASGCGIPRCVPSYQRRGLHSRAARQSQTGTSRNRRHEVIVEVPPRVGSPMP